VAIEMAVARVLDKTAFFTGGSSGIGLATAKAFERAHELQPTARNLHRRHAAAAGFRQRTFQKQDHGLVQNTTQALPRADGISFARPTCSKISLGRRGWRWLRGGFFAHPLRSVRGPHTDRRDGLLAALQTCSNSLGVRSGRTASCSQGRKSSSSASPAASSRRVEGDLGFHRPTPPTADRPRSEPATWIRFRPASLAE
jgi:hypothetical protein